MRISPYSLSIAAILAGSAIAQAQTSTANLNVTITIKGECLVDVDEDLAFGTHGLLTSNIDAQAAFTVRCNNGLPYSIAMGPGGSQDTNARVMTAGSYEVSYQLYTAGARTDVWDDSQTGMVSDVGTGQDKTHIVYGRVGPQDTPPASSYSDTVAITVSY